MSGLSNGWTIAPPGAASAGLAVCGDDRVGCRKKKKGPPGLLNPVGHIAPD
jgi:hypothetical protein